MKIFVTGHKGYIGPHLIELLRNENFYVSAVDVELFPDSVISEVVKPDLEKNVDIRKLNPDDLEGFDAVVHLAAISNDPMGDFKPHITTDINLDASVRLATIAKQAGVKKFLFSSSCSIYGKGENLDLDESAQLNPQSVYAESKIKAEAAIREMADDSFCPALLRNATAYGYSPNFRIDLVVNNLLACALTKGEIRIMSDGSPWRPLIHCRDIARAFVAFLKAPEAMIFNKAVNIGSNKENYQVKDVADLVRNLMPQAKVVFTGEAVNDPRNYRVNFDLLTQIIPGFELEYTLERGMQELYHKLIDYGFTLSDFESDTFVRLKSLKKNIGKLEYDL